MLEYARLATDYGCCRSNRTYRSEVVIMDPNELCGVFPVGNPIPYTGRSKMVSGNNIPAVRTWYHGTWANHVASIAQLGLVPSCWFGGVCCCVFGFDTSDFTLYQKYGDWMVEVKSRVDAGTDAKAWWVPPQRIVGAWHKGQFYTRESLLTVPGNPILGRLWRIGCFDKLCRRQYEIWRTTYLVNV